MIFWEGCSLWGTHPQILSFLMRSNRWGWHITSQFPLSLFLPIGDNICIVFSRSLSHFDQIITFLFWNLKLMFVIFVAGCFWIHYQSVRGRLYFICFLGSKFDYFLAVIILIWVFIGFITVIFCSGENGKEGE